MGCSDCNFKTCPTAAESRDEIGELAIEALLETRAGVSENTLATMFNGGTWLTIIEPKSGEARTTVIREGLRDGARLPAGPDGLVQTSAGLKSAVCPGSMSKFEMKLVNKSNVSPEALRVAVWHPDGSIEFMILNPAAGTTPQEVLHRLRVELTSAPTETNEPAMAA